MTTSAIIMMALAWSVIIFFMAKFLLKALKTPNKN